MLKAFNPHCHAASYTLSLWYRYGDLLKFIYPLIHSPLELWCIFWTSFVETAVYKRNKNAHRL